MTAGDSDQPLECSIKDDIASSGPLMLMDKEAECDAKNERRLTRKVSQEDFPSMTNASKRSPQYVSCAEDEEEAAETRDNRSDSPMRCVSDFDKVASISKSESDEDMDESVSGYHLNQRVPPFPNPLHDANLRSVHVRALRLETELQPIRLILSRLMAHPAHNKKGLFNAPVDAAALGLVDYHTVIKKPMDLGSIKAKLYAVAYQSREEAAEDIRLVCRNAMTYNPPGNAVHTAARGLQEFFEELYAAVGGERKEPSFASQEPMIETLPQAPPAPECRRVSFAQLPQDKRAVGSAALVAPTGVSRTVSSDVDLSIVTSKSESPTAMEVQENPSTGDTQAHTLADASPSHVSALTTSQPTRARGSATGSPQANVVNQRKRRLGFGAKRTRGHNCRGCLGRSCLLCEQGCLQLEPTLLICNGAMCAGAKVRKGATYYIAKDGSRQYCQRCYVGLPPVFSHGNGEDDPIRYKRDLLKRKNDEEVVEKWLTCYKCDSGVHQICAMHNEYVHSSEDYVCPSCTTLPSQPKKTGSSQQYAKDVYTFITGSEEPVAMSDIADTSFGLGEDALSADALAETDVSSFIEEKVRSRIAEMSGVENAQKTISVRIISDCDRRFTVPDVIRKHFRMPTGGDGVDSNVAPPKSVSYNSKAIALFQKTDGLDVCIFCMYVQEYAGDEEYDEVDQSDSVSPFSKKRVYIAYLDSVEHFRPRSCRTHVYHELLVSYLASARKRGFESAYIWACPPSRGNSFVFWNHPSSQRTPTRERLISWYHGALSRAIDCGVVTDVKSLYETEFQNHLQEIEKENDDASVEATGKMLCPPLLEGDYWIEEAVRIHSASLARHLKTKSANEGKDLGDTQVLSSLENGWDPCPAKQVGALLVDRVMAHTSAAPFRRPVNAAAMKLKNYHEIVARPMDLGTVYSKCVHGEYHQLSNLVEDVELVFDNARRFNPVGHVVHDMAIDMQKLFYRELDELTRGWTDASTAAASHDDTWQSFADMSMSLDKRLTAQHVPGRGIANLSSKLSVGGTANSGSSGLIANQVVAKGGKEQQSEKDLKLLTGGPDAVSQRMVGDDTWLIDKKNAASVSRTSAKKGSKGGKAGGKRRRSSISSSNPDESSQKRRRQTWLGEEVGACVRSLRTSFFACSLVPKSILSKQEEEKSATFSSYASCYCGGESPQSEAISSKIADARHALLEFSQFRNLEFDTLRHAKYSTAILLYHLHNEDAPGLIPTCTLCNQEMKDCRWHKIAKVEALRKSPHRRKPSQNAVDGSSPSHDEELCSSCYASHPKRDQFIPLHVSFNSS